MHEMSTEMDTEGNEDEAGIRVGVDLCAVADVAAAIERFGDRYLHAVYTADELAYCAAGGTARADRLAARFAAKEATMKVLRPDDTGIDLRSIEIRRQPGGWCDIHLAGSAAVLAARARIDGLAVSMSHEGGMAAAVVIAGTSSGADTSKGQRREH